MLAGPMVVGPHNDRVPHDRQVWGMTEAALLSDEDPITDLVKQEVFGVYGQLVSCIAFNVIKFNTKRIKHLQLL
jgi:hypothetical protein